MQNIKFDTQPLHSFCVPYSIELSLFLISNASAKAKNIMQTHHYVFVPDQAQQNLCTTTTLKLAHG
jgi:hypothetical protein